jgi:DNA-binding transcriptional MocR family regulator
MKPHEWQRAIRDTQLDGTTKAVGWALDARMNGDDACWPSKTTLAADCGFSVRTVDRAIRRLELIGFLKVRRRPPAANVYIARLPRHSDGVTPSHSPVDPVTGAGKVVKKRESEERKPLTATAAASAITVDVAMLELARGWLASSGAHH